MRYAMILMLLALVAVRAADTDLAARYTGEWKSNNSGGGAFRLILEHASGGAWEWEVTFVYAGAEVQTRVNELKLEGSKLEGSYDFELQGFALRSHITGEWNGKAFEGHYQTGTTDGANAVDEGTWHASPAK